MTLNGSRRFFLAGDAAGAGDAVLGALLDIGFEGRLDRAKCIVEGGRRETFNQASTQSAASTVNAMSPASRNHHEETAPLCARSILRATHATRTAQTRNAFRTHRLLPRTMRPLRCAMSQ